MLSHAIGNKLIHKPKTEFEKYLHNCYLFLTQNDIVRRYDEKKTKT